jgi:hypothetical protein
MEFDVETMRIHTVSVNPQTNTVMDPRQWAQRIGQIPLESRSIIRGEFARVDECACDSGGSCCNAELQLHLTNESVSESLKVYTDDLVATDPRVRPTHRTFSVISFSPDIFNANGRGIRVETSESHTFSDGDLVQVLSSATGLPAYCRAIECGFAESTTGLTLVPLFPDQAFTKSMMAAVSVRGLGESVGRISNRQLLYVLGPEQTISFSAIATKGSGRDWVKWSPGWAFYRPLFRDNAIDRTVKLSKEKARGLVARFFFFGR